ncbi:hypothetical protein MC885_009991 [Smutsia gigantea]|nr:hypothetical protein MC885_009991 [Smutsia gigantea]
MQVDGFTHLYTLVLRPDLTYEVKIDGQGIESGNIEYDWNLTSLKKMVTSSAESKDWNEAEGFVSIRVLVRRCDAGNQDDSTVTTKALSPERVCQNQRHLCTCQGVVKDNRNERNKPKSKKVFTLNTAPNGKDIDPTAPGLCG